LRLAAVAVLVLAASLAAAGSSDNPKLSDGLEVKDFGIGGDGTTVVYGSWDGADFELWTVPIDGSAAPVGLHGPGSAFSFWFSSDSARIFFRGRLDPSPALELYVAPSDGSGVPLKLSGPLTHCSATGLSCDTAGDCPDAGICVDGGEVCLTSLDCPGMFNGCIGITPQSCDPTGNVDIYFLSPDDAWVAYEADHEVDDVLGLYGVPTDGSTAPVKLDNSLPLPPSGQPFLSLIGAGNRVAFWTRREIGELYSVPIDGGEAPTKLAGPIVSGGYVRHMLLTGDGTRVVYAADQETADLVDIYSVPIDGSAPPVRLKEGFDQGSRISISHDDEFLVYVNQEASALFRVPIDGSSPPVQLSPPLGAGEQIDRYTLSGNSPRAAYGVCEGAGACAIHTAPIDGTESPIEVVPPTPGLSLRWITSQSSRLLYWDQDPQFTSNLFSVPWDGSQPPVLLNDPIAPGRVASIDPFQEGSLYIYSVEPDGEELYVVPITRSLPPVRVNGPLPTALLSNFFSLNADETWAVYIAAQETEGLPELWSRHLDLDGDGVPDETDNCPTVANAGQGPVVFPQTLRASTRTEFSWAHTVDDVAYVRGDIDSVGSYGTDESGALTDVVAFEDATEPAPGGGLYYLVKSGGSCAAASWQTVPGAEPGRDVVLP